MSARGRGILHVVATPIGNLSDLTLRALEVLREADAVFAEDTRRTRRLLAHHGLRPALVSAHAHNERGRVAELLRRLEDGEQVALVSDAGSPAVSDPGADLVAAVAAAGYPVRSVPGPSAVVAALAVSGLPSDRFSFGGFLPARAGARDRRLAELLARPETVVLFEAPHRVRETLEALARLAPERRLAACRELTKTFEEVLRGRPSEVRSLLTSERERGEWTLVLGPSSSASTEGAGEPSAQGREPDPASRGRRSPRASKGEGAREAMARSLEESGLTREEARQRAEFVYGGVRRRRTPRDAKRRAGRREPKG